MIYIIRNNQQFGPYDEPTLLSYVNSGHVLLGDKARDATSNEENTVKCLLKKAGYKPKVQHGGDLVSQLRKIGSKLIIPKSTFINKQWLSDKRLLMLALIGLFPSILMFLPIVEDSCCFILLPCISLLFGECFSITSSRHLKYL